MKKLLISVLFVTLISHCKLSDDVQSPGTCSGSGPEPELTDESDVTTDADENNALAQAKGPIDLGDSSVGPLYQFEFAVAGVPYDTATGFDYGPGDWPNRYTQNRQYFPVLKANCELGVVWQDQGDGSVYLSWLSAALDDHQTGALDSQSGQTLVAVTGDGAGHVYTLSIQEGSGAGSPDVARTVILRKFNEAGLQLASSHPDASQNGLNIVAFDGDAATLSYANGVLGLIVGRTMHKSSDGLNHQGGIAVLFDADDLSLIENWGQTSGHSFDNMLTTDGQGGFLAVDLADNYPRGIHLHRFDSVGIDSRVVYTFKTAHGTTATSPAGQTYPAYTEISGSGTTYYQWSNDNNTYTELGNVNNHDEGYVVVYAGENGNGSQVLSNNQTGELLNTARNLGLTLVRTDFENASSGEWNEVTDDLVLTDGATETGGFYSFGGGWSPQRTTGTVWLTSYSDASSENVSRVKSAVLPSSNVLIIWEKWTPNSYVSTHALLVDAYGNSQGSVATLDGVRLNRRDEAIEINGRVYLISGRGSEQQLVVTMIDAEGN